MLNTESSSALNLRKQIKQLSNIAQDTEWQLQEQLAHCSNTLTQEKELSSELKSKLSVAEAKLIEIEMYFTTDKGILALQLEQELANAKLKIAELEAEKDELEFDYRNRTNIGKTYAENSIQESHIL